MGDQVDQHGWVRTPKNLQDIPKSVLDGKEVSDVRLTLMRIADSVLDGFVKVSIIACAIAVSDVVLGCCQISSIRRRILEGQDCCLWSSVIGSTTPNLGGVCWTQLCSEDSSRQRGG